MTPVIVSESVLPSVSIQAMQAEDRNNTEKRGTLGSAVTMAAQAQQAITRNTFTASLVFLLSTTVSKISVCRLFVS